MKNSKTLVFILLILLLSTSCGKNETSDPTSTFSVDPESLGFTRNSGRKSITIKCDGVWSASVSGSWATVDPTMGSSDDKLYVSVSTNPNFGQTRSCVVTITNGGESKEVSVLQKANAK